MDAIPLEVWSATRCGLHYRYLEKITCSPLGGLDCQRPCDRVQPPSVMAANAAGTAAIGWSVTTAAHEIPPPGFDVGKCGLDPILSDSVCQAPPSITSECQQLKCWAYKAQRQEAAANLERVAGLIAARNRLMSAGNSRLKMGDGFCNRK